MNEKPDYKKKVVLYADDDPDDRWLLNEAFSRYTHKADLHTFGDGVEILHNLKQLHKQNRL